MLSVLRNRSYRQLFAAQVIALLGTGLMTVALGLLAFEIAGAEAGAVLGTALAIKMAAYVGLAPVAQALAERMPRKRVLVALDLIRAGVALCLPFVTEVWQIYLLIFLLQAASAGFTPMFQATIPDILPGERDYTNALSLSRLAYDLENLLSPVLAAALLTVIGFHALFAGTAFGFLVSAALVMSVAFPALAPSKPRGVWERTTRGLRRYLATPRLRGLLALNLAVAAAGAMVIVNTVVIVKAGLGLGERDVAIALAAFGGGSMIMVLTLPRLLERTGDRGVMLGGAGILILGLLIGSLSTGFAPLLMLWLVMGVGCSAVQTPSGRLLRRSAPAELRSAIFAAQFALSHACWLIAYPLAGWLGATAGLPAAFLVLAVIAAIGGFAAIRLWPASDEVAAVHDHPDLPPDHPHLRENGARPHRHAPISDELHCRSFA